MKKGRETPFVFGHPWIFSGAIDKIIGHCNAGDMVMVQNAKKEFIAWGLFNPNSQIRVRLYSWQEEQKLTDDFWIQRILRAITLRKDLYQNKKANYACRLIFSEGDSLSGLTVDQVNEFLVVQFTSLAIYEKKDLILSTLQTILQPKGIYLRTEKGIQEEEGLNVKDGIVCGSIPEEPVCIEENGIVYKVSIQTGQKTGFYTDQRLNRLAIRQYAKDRKCLDICCYSGGFALNLAQAGAKQITAVDVSASALSLAKQNIDLNLTNNIDLVHSDAFKYLEKQKQEGQLYDLIVLDPPKFTHSKESKGQALNGYLRLNRLAMSILNNDGYLLTCSCSGRVSYDDFLRTLAQAAWKEKRELQIIEKRSAAPDHPIMAACPESAYLKCVITRLL